MASGDPSDAPVLGALLASSRSMSSVEAEPSGLMYLRGSEASPRATLREREIIRSHMRHLHVDAVTLHGRY
jgi:hypothetical protein